MEYRKAVAGFSFDIAIKYGSTIDVDNTTDVDNFWTAVKDCLTTTYGDNATVSPDGNSVTVKFSDFQETVFSKTDTGVVHSPKMPFYVSTDDTLYLTGQKEKIVAPIVNKTGLTIAGIAGKQKFASSVSGYTLYYDALLYVAIALDIIGALNGYTFFPLKESDSYSLTDLSYTYDKNDIVAIFRQMGFDTIADTVSTTISDKFGYFLVKAVSLSYKTSGWDDLSVRESIFNTLHFYDSGYVGEASYTMLVSPFKIVSSDVFEVTLTVDMYDSDGNVVHQDLNLTATLNPRATTAINGKLNQVNKTIFSFGKVKRNQPFDYGSLQSKTSDTSPVYSVDKIPEGTKVGDYVVVFNDDFYAYRTVVSIDTTNNTIELDSDVPSIPAFFSPQIPDSYAISYPISSNLSSYITGYVAWRLSSATVVYLNDTYFGQVRDLVASDNTGAYEFQVEPLDADITKDIMVSDTDVMADLLPTYDQFYAQLSNSIVTPLPKQPVGDGELTTEYLSQLFFLKVSDYYNGYPDKILGLGLPFVIVQVGDDFKDFVGYVDFIAVYSKEFADRYPSKAYLNANNLNEDNQAILLKKLVAGDDYSLYLSEGLLSSDKLFVVR